MQVERRTKQTRLFFIPSAAYLLFIRIKDNASREKNKNILYICDFTHDNSINKMENLGDWLYVIILIIAGISSMISSVRKKAKQVAEETQPREIITGDTFEDDYWGKEATNRQQPQKQPVLVNEPKAKIKQSHQFQTKQKTSYFTGQQEGVPAIKHNNTEQILADTENEYTPITLDDLPHETNEWRKAFIYNEIFNRKY